MLSLLTTIYSSLKSALSNSEIDSTQINERNRRKALTRQRALEKAELRQSWNITFGLQKPAKNHELQKINDITLRNIWMEELFIYHAIVALQPQEIFHSPEKYMLQWQPPGSTFFQNIPLIDRKVQEQAVQQMSRMRSKDQKKVLFHLMTTNPLLHTFAPRVHPASLVSYRTKPEVLNKLCNYFRDGKISITDFTFILECDSNAWNKVLYNMLTDDERVYHTYLNEEIESSHGGGGGIENKHYTKSLEKKYINGLLSLNEYENMRFPELKRLKDEETASYPIPYPKGNCVICANDDAYIKCQSCSNLVCLHCVRTRFSFEAHQSDSSEGAFFYVHRRYCLKFGVRTSPAIEVVPEPGYLRELRQTGRDEAVKMVPEEDGLDSDEEEARQRRKLQLELIRQEEEAERVRNAELAAQREMRERLEYERRNHPTLLGLQDEFKKCSNRLESLRKELMGYQTILDTKSHNKFFIKRTIQQKSKARKGVVKVEVKLASILTGVQALGFGSITTDLEEQLRMAKIRASTLASLESVEEMLNLESNLQQKLAMKESLELIMKYS